MSKLLKSAIAVGIVYFILIVLFTITVNAGNIKLNTLNTVNISGPINNESMLSVKEELYRLHIKRNGKIYPIYLVIDSPGGSIYSGNSFIEMVKTIPNVNTVTIYAASMASAIVQQVNGKRYALDNSIMMFHRARGQFSGQFNDGEVEKQIALWKSVVSKMEKRNAKRMKMSLTKYKKLVKDEYWLHGKDLKTKNAVDTIITISCSKHLVEKIVNKKVQTMFGLFETSVSACPHLR